MSESDTSENFRPVSGVKVRNTSTTTDELILHVPEWATDQLGIEFGDRMVPVVQDGMLVYIPVDWAGESH